MVRIRVHNEHIRPGPGEVAGEGTADAAGSDDRDPHGANIGDGPFVRPYTRRVAGPVDPHCTVEVDGRRLEAIEGQSLAAVLVANGVWRFKRNPASGEPRGPFCGMGVCLECELVVDGRPGVRACLTPARDGMQVATAFPAG